MWSRWWHGEGLAVPLSRAVCASSHLPPIQRLKVLRGEWWGVSSPTL